MINMYLVEFSFNCEIESKTVLAFNDNRAEEIVKNKFNGARIYSLTKCFNELVYDYNECEFNEISKI